MRRTLTHPTRPLGTEGGHRLIPARYSDVGTVMAEIGDDDAMLSIARMRPVRTSASLPFPTAAIPLPASPTC